VFELENFKDLYVLFYYKVPFMTCESALYDNKVFCSPRDYSGARSGPVFPVMIIKRTSWFDDQHTTLHDISIYCVSVDGIIRIQPLETEFEEPVFSVISDKMMV
jgi:hypothetical protein